MRGCILEWMGGSLRQTSSLVLSTTSAWSTWCLTSFKSAPQVRSTFLPISQWRGEREQGVFELERWRETHCWLMEAHFYCKTDCSIARIAHLWVVLVESPNKLCIISVSVSISPLSPPFACIHSQTHICRTCGSILSPVLEKAPPTGSALSHIQPEWKCRLCEDRGQIDIISVPHIFRYLVAELAAVNINLKLETS